MSDTTAKNKRFLVFIFLTKIVSTVCLKKKIKMLKGKEIFVNTMRAYEEGER